MDCQLAAAMTVLSLQKVRKAASENSFTVCCPCPLCGGSAIPLAPPPQSRSLRKCEVRIRSASGVSRTTRRTPMLKMKGKEYLH